MGEAFALEMPSRGAIGFDRGRWKARVGRCWTEAFALAVPHQKKRENLEANMAAPDVIKELVACGLVCLKATQHGA
jgi:hypothetical protein